MPRIIGQNRIARVNIGNRPIPYRPGGAVGASAVSGLGYYFNHRGNFYQAGTHIGLILPATTTFITVPVASNALFLVMGGGSLGGSNVGGGGGGAALKRVTGLKPGDIIECSFTPFTNSGGPFAPQGPDSYIKWPGGIIRATCGRFGDADGAGVPGAGGVGLGGDINRTGGRGGAASNQPGLPGEFGGAGGPAGSGVSGGGGSAGFSDLAPAFFGVANANTLQGTNQLLWTAGSPGMVGNNSAGYLGSGAGAGANVGYSYFSGGAWAVFLSFA